MRALLFVFIAGCSLSHGASAGSANTAAPSPAAPTSAPEESDPNAIPRPDQGDHHAFLPEDFDAMKGLTVDAAKAEAKKRGHVGEVRVEQLDNFSSTCKPNTVCKAEDVRGGQSGMGLDDVLVLYTNKQSTIAIPD
jgi:hypothetical protein